MSSPAVGSISVPWWAVWLGNEAARSLAGLKIRPATSSASGPLILTTPIPAVPTGVAMADMVEDISIEY